MPILRADHLTKRFGTFEAVKDLSFTVEEGEVFAFLGPNGAGKTTTIKMLTTLLHPTEGAITLDGHDPVRHPDQARRSFGIVFQDPSVDDELTAWENMEFHGVLYGVPLDLRRKRMEELLNVVELWDRKDSLVKQFSGGMKRRLEIARGLLHHPRMLFLDEPTTGLDPQTRNHIWTYIKDLNVREHITVFFTTHYMDEADRMASRVIIMDHGRMIAEGSPEKLKQTTGTTSLEEAFLKLTGSAIRADEASAADGLRLHRQMWRGKNKN